MSLPELEKLLTKKLQEAHSLVGRLELTMGQVNVIRGLLSAEAATP